MVTDPFIQLVGISLAVTSPRCKLLSGSVKVWMNEMLLALPDVPLALQVISAR